MRTVIFDIETKNFFDTIHSNNPADLDISVVCAYDSQTGQYLSFTADNFDELWALLRNTDSIVTYNGNHFDLPCLQSVAPIDLSAIHHIDIFADIQTATGKKISLNDIAQTTLGIAKSGHGSDAVAWWNAGELQKIIDYCIQDVRVTKSVYDHIIQHGSVSYTDRNTQQTVTVPIDTSQWALLDDDDTQEGLF